MPGHGHITNHEEIDPQHDLIEQVSAAVHEAWMTQKKTNGFTTAPTKDGEEQLVPYDQLSEGVKEYDRVTVRAVLAALKRLGYDVIAPDARSGA